MQMSDHWKVILKKKKKTENDIKKAKRLTGIKFFAKGFIYILQSQMKSLRKNSSNIVINSNYWELVRLINQSISLLMHGQRNLIKFETNKQIW